MVIHVFNIKHHNHNVLTVTQRLCFCISRLILPCFYPSGWSAECATSPFSLLLRPVLLPTTGPPDTGLFLLGHPHGNQATNLRRRHKTCSFRGHRNTCHLGQRGGPDWTRSHVRTQSHTNACSHIFSHEQRVSVTFKWDQTSAPLQKLIYLLQEDWDWCVISSPVFFF